MRTINIELIDRTIRVEVYSPAKTPAPGILLLHEIAGLLDFYRQDAQHLANLGYLVYVPDLYSSQATRYCIRAMVLAAGRKNASDSIPAREVHCLLDALQQDADCNGKLGMLGACLTGGFVIQMAKRNDMLAPVLYHHSLGIEGAGVPNNEPLDTVTRLQAHWGNIDPICQAIRQKKLREKLGDRLEYYHYDLPHGFRSTGRLMAESALVWDRTITFFEQHLK